MKNIAKLLAVTACVSMLAYTFALPALCLKELSADYVLDAILLKEQDKQKLQQTLQKLPEDIQGTIKERILARYKLQLFSALSIKAIPLYMIFDDTPACLSQCGKYALIKSCDTTPIACIYDLSTGNMVKTLEGVTIATFSPDGERILTDSYDNTARLWDIATGGTIKILEDHTGPINSVAFSPCSKFALTGSNDGTVRLWNLKTGETIKTLQSSFSVETCPLSVAFSACGRYALTISFVEIVLWDLETGEVTSKFKLSPITLGSGVINALAHSWDKTVLLLNKILHHARNYKVSSIALSFDTKHALTGSVDGTVRFWDTTTGETIKVLEGHTAEILSVALSHDGRYALTGSYDKTARLWDLSTGTTVVLEGCIDQANSAVFGPEGNYALMGSFNFDTQRDMVYIWNLEHIIKDLDLEQLLSILIDSNALSKPAIKDNSCTLL